GFPDQRADTGRAVHLVTGNRVEVRVQGREVNGRMRYGLRAVDKHRDAARVRERDDLAHRVHGAECIRDVHDADEFRPVRKTLLECFEDQLAAFVDGCGDDLRTGLLGDELPGYDVGVVLHVRDQYL